MRRVHVKVGIEVFVSHDRDILPQQRGSGKEIFRSRRGENRVIELFPARRFDAGGRELLEAVLRRQAEKDGFKCEKVSAAFLVLKFSKPPGTACRCAS